ncbi:MAG: YHS domain protein [Flavobacteriaceae bacterium]|nr:YHS domain protein [Flavobacteriaceae bacterium]
MKKIILSLIILTSFNSFAQKEELIVKHSNLNNKNVAIDGYDPVSYFDDNPLKGKPSIQSKFKGILYHFVNDKNKNLFVASPDKFVPQYGGWCAYALANKGKLMNINPKTYKISEGKLYLFYNKFFTNTLDDWNENEGNMKNKGDKNWNKIIEK